MGLVSGERNTAATLMKMRSSTMNPRRTSNKNENFATMEFEFKNSFEPDKSESTDPELKLLNDGRSPPESGASVVAGIDDDDDEDDDEDEDGDSAFRNESGIIDPSPPLSLPLLPLLPLLLLLLPLLPLLPNTIIYFIILYYFNNIIILIILLFYYLWKS
jgi:hypothetical protein